MTRTFRLRHAALALALLAPALPARADISAAQAQDIEKQLRAWLSTQLGPGVDVSAVPLKVTAEADHYRVDIPFGGPVMGGAATLSQGAITTNIKPLDGGRWGIEGFKLPSPFRLALANAPKDGPTAFSLKIAEQDGKGMLDPSLATASNFDNKLRGYTVTTETAKGPSTAHVDQATSSVVWDPAVNGRVSARGEANLDKYTVTNTMPDGTPFTVTIDRLRATSRVNNVLLASLPTMIQSAVALSNEAAKSPNEKTMNPAQRAAARSFVTALAALLDSAESEHRAENIKVASGDMQGTLKTFAIAFGFGAPDGKMDLHWRIQLAGLESPVIPPGVYRDYLPKQIVLAPRISGVPKNDVVQLALKAIDTDPDQMDALEGDAMALLAKGPLKVALDELALDVGPAKLTGNGVVAVSSPADVSGNAEIHVTGLDTLIRNASTTPELKPAAPVLVFLKGIGRQNGDDTVWKVAYSGHKLLVNDTDLTAMIPSGN